VFSYVSVYARVSINSHLFCGYKTQHVVLFGGTLLNFSPSSKKNKTKKIMKVKG